MKIGKSNSANICEKDATQAETGYKKTHMLMKSSEAVDIKANDYDKFGVYLANVMKIRKMISKNPPEIMAVSRCSYKVRDNLR